MTFPTRSQAARSAAKFSGGGPAFVASSKWPASRGNPGRGWSRSHSAHSPPFTLRRSHVFVLAISAPGTARIGALQRSLIGWPSAFRWIFGPTMLLAPEISGGEWFFWGWPSIDRTPCMFFGGIGPFEMALRGGYLRLTFDTPPRARALRGSPTGHSDANGALSQRIVPSDREAFLNGEFLRLP